MDTMSPLLRTTRVHIEKWLIGTKTVEIVKDAYDKGAKNCKMISHPIQKDITKACAEEVMSIIMDEIGDKKFSVLIDESRDVSIKEHMAVILRLVNNSSIFVSRLLLLLVLVHLY